MITSVWSHVIPTATACLRFAICQWISIVTECFFACHTEDEPVYPPTDEYCSPYPHNTRNWLSGMDIDHKINNRKDKHTRMDDPSPQEQQERARILAEQQRRDKLYGRAQPVDQGICYGVPSMGLRTGASRTMGDRAAELKTWDHRATRAEPPKPWSSTRRGRGPTFEDLRIGEQKTPANTGQSSYPPGMQVDQYQLERDMESLQLNDGASPSRSGRHPQPFPPGMNNSVQDGNLAFAGLRINEHEEISATARVSNGNPHLPGMGFWHVFSHGGEEM